MRGPRTCLSVWPMQFESTIEIVREGDRFRREEHIVPDDTGR